MLDLSTWIDRWAAHSPDKTAINWGGGQLSYGALAKRIRMLAATLGAEPGDRIAYLGQNSPHLIELVFACARLGAIAVPLNWRLAMDEHRYVLEDCGARTLIYEPNYAETTANLGLTRIKANTWNSAALPRSRGGPDSRVLIVYTSGTTGRPKGAVLDQRALACNAINSTVMHNLTSADRVLTTIPLFHIGGLNIQTLPALHAGATIYLHSVFDVEATFAAIARDRPTLMVLVPAQMQAMLAHPSWADCDLSCLRMVTTGSTTVPHGLIEAFHARGVPVGQVYGCTETAPIATCLCAEQASDHVGSVGLPARHCEVRVVDDDGRDVAAGERGEIWVRGDNVMREYWNNPKASAAAFSDGWFRTGDIAERDDDGFLSVVDRKHDMIISGSENIYPAEIERVLADAPAISAVAVVGRADQRWGEVAVAVVVRRDAGLDESGVLALLEGRLARYKHPHDVIFVDALPRNAMGKVEKHVLRGMV